MKEYEIIKVSNITYTNRRIICQKGIFNKIIIPYDDISSFYICNKTCLYFGLLYFARCIAISTKDGNKYFIPISIVNNMFHYDSFEKQHIKFIKKMAPQAKYLKRIKISTKIKRKLKQINSYLKSDD